tara:strand:- start:1516 stop:3753 length:2238 start_codon:yes stop_codon:yes gene_type:complete
MSLTTLGAILATALPASAQNAAVPGTPPASAFEEIVVTAQKRAQKISEVPIAISAFSQENIEQTGITQLREVADFIPNLQISRGTDFTSSITIRGVGANSRNIGFDTRVGVYLDGVYLGQSPAINQELVDLERMEVLRGPQGTLFGKNTVAGAISLVSRKPTDELEGRFSAALGNLDDREFQGHLNVPLGETVAAKISLSKQDRDGYIRNLHTGNKLNARDSFAWRAQLRAGLSDSLELNLAMDGLHSDRLSFLGEPSTDTFVVTLSDTPDPYVTNTGTDTSEDRDIYGGNINLDYQFDNGYSLKSITAYRKTEIFYINDSDYAVADWITIEYDDNYKQFSQEFQLLSPGEGPLNYVLGLYYFYQSGDTRRDARVGEDIFPFEPGLIAAGLGFLVPVHGSTIFNQGTVKTNSYAAYLNGGYDITERLQLGFGLRYTYEEKDVDWLLDGRTSGLFRIASTDGTLRDERSDEHLSHTLSLGYEFTENFNSYVKYSTGFKSGGFNLDYVTADTLAEGIDFDKETVDSFELGLKANFLDNRVILNLAAFLSKFDDYQVNQFIELGDGSSITIKNAAEVETKGVEAELIYRPLDSLEIQASAGYLDATFNDFPDALGRGGNAAGNDLINAPEWNYAVSIQYVDDIPDFDAQLLLRGDLTHSSGYFTTVENIKTITTAMGNSVDFGYIEPITLVNGRIGLASLNETWEIYLWARNLFDKKQPIDNIRDFFNTIVENYSEPRTYGVELIWNF